MCDRGWTHHIQRLMVLGDHALQRDYDPRAREGTFIYYTAGDSVRALLTEALRPAGAPAH